MLAAATAFAIPRRDVGIVYPGKPDDRIADDVALRIDVQGLASAATPPTPAPLGR